MNFDIPIVMLLFMAACTQSFALQQNVEVSRERAKELGVTIRSNVDGENGVKVWLEFLPRGVLQNFSQVDLTIGAPGKRLVVAPLLVSRPAPGMVSVHFSTDVANLATSELTIVVQDGARDRNGFHFKVKDFIEPEAKKSADAPPVYETAEQIRAMFPCRAVVESAAPCSLLLTTADGRVFYLGSPGATGDVSGFLGTLQAGQAYEFPAAFNTYQKTQR
jgi:hypothetical protein